MKKQFFLLTLLFSNVVFSQSQVALNHEEEALACSVELYESLEELDSIVNEEYPINSPRDIMDQGELGVAIGTAIFYAFDSEASCEEIKQQVSEIENLALMTIWDYEENSYFSEMEPVFAECDSQDAVNQLEDKLIETPIEDRDTFQDLLQLFQVIDLNARSVSSCEELNDMLAAISEQIDLEFDL